MPVSSPIAGGGGSGQFPPVHGRRKEAQTGKNANFAAARAAVPLRSHLEAIDIFRPPPPCRRTEGEGGMAGPAGMAPRLAGKPTVSRMKKGDYVLQTGTKAFELGVLFVRLFRSLDAIVGGDEASARAWLANPNLALGATPAEKIRTVAGLVDVITYLHARQALV
jgi:hypothetical protein